MAAKFPPDGIENAVEILDQIGIPEAHHLEPLLVQFGGSPGIVGGIPFQPVLASVEFDNEFSFKRNEVGDIGSYRLLTAELEPVESAIAESVPEFAFEVGLIAA